MQTHAHIEPVTHVHLDVKLQQEIESIVPWYHAPVKRDMHSLYMFNILPKSYFFQVKWVFYNARCWDSYAQYVLFGW